jgi:hypothetical protein
MDFLLIVKVVKGFGNIDKGLKDAITQTQECWKRLESIQMTTILANTFQTQALVRGISPLYSGQFQVLIANSSSQVSQQPVH